MMDSMKSTNNSDNAQPQEETKMGLQGASGSQSSSNRIDMYQNKLTSIKQRFNAKSGADTGTNKDSSTQQQMNTSFSAMNSSLSQKWNQITAKTASKKEGSGTQLSNTMGGFTGASAANNVSGIGRGSQGGGNMNSSIGAGSSGDQSNTASGGATNQDLNKRLAEMKAKLQALKKK